MSGCILHIGMHKTGTSSIQQSLNGFADGRFVYAHVTGHPNHSRAIFEMLDFRPGSRSAGQESAHGRNPADPAAAAAKLERSIADANGRTWLASGEGMSLLPPAALRRLHDFLRPRFGHVAIVAAVRAPAGYMASAFQEPIKQGARDDLKLARRYRNYRRTFEKFDEVFGRENVQLWKFDPGTFPGGCAVRDFCGRLGIELPAERIVRVNESLSREAMGLLFTYRKLGRDLGSMSMSGPQNTGLVEQLMKIGRTRFRFSPDAVRPVLEENRADIQWMEARLGASLNEDLEHHHPGDVKEEADLLVPDSRAVAELRALLGARAPGALTGHDTRQVALLVHALRGEGVPAAALEAGMGLAEPGTGGGTISIAESTQEGSSKMETSELIQKLQQAEPKLLEGIPAERVQALLQGAFKQMAAALSGAGDGAVEFAGLGRFRVRKVQREVNGKMLDRVRIIFQPEGAGAAGKARERRRRRKQPEAEE